MWFSFETIKHIIRLHFEIDMIAFVFNYLFLLLLHYIFVSVSAKILAHFDSEYYIEPN